MLIKESLSFYWQAKTVYALHSPFLYNFYTHVFKNDVDPVLIRKIEAERNRLKASSEVNRFNELGAGTGGHRMQERKVSDIARKSLSSSWQCRIIANLVKYYSLSTVVELGTSLGISAAYLAAINPKAQIHTFEGDPRSLALAKEVWANLDLKNIDEHLGDFAETIPQFLTTNPTIELVFIDGNHRLQPTLDYFEQFLANRTDQSIFVFDDIYWSQGMKTAWDQIRKHKDVTLSIDCYRMGIVFFRDTGMQASKHVKLIDFKLKPFNNGVFGG